MNSVMQSRVQMSEEVLKSLLTEVKETVASGIDALGTTRETATKSNFAAINMWKIRRNAKSASQLMNR